MALQRRYNRGQVAQRVAGQVGQYISSVPRGTMTAWGVGGGLYKYMSRSKNPSSSGAVNRSRNITSASIPNKGANARRRSKVRQLRTLKGKKLRKEVLSLKNQVRELKSETDQSISELTYRYLFAERITCASNGQNVQNYLGNDKDIMETALTQLKYWDAATSAFVTSSGVTGTNEKNFLFPSISSTITMRNNYQSDCEVIVYLCKPRVDTDTTVISAYTNGIADDLGNVSTYADYGSLPTDYQTTKDFWNFKRISRKVLQAGEALKLNHNEKDIVYDPSFTDSHSLTYQKGNKAFLWCVIVRGCVGHGSAGNEGTLAAGVDVTLSNTYKIKYNGGSNFQFTYISNNFGTMTAPVQGKCPIPDNIAYSTT